MAEGSDWGHPSGSDAATICGEDDDRALARALGPALGSSLTRAAGRHIDPVRVLVWTLTGLLALCVFSLTLAAWSRTAKASESTVSGAAYPLRVVFGDPGTNMAASDGPNGSETVCTDETFDARSAAWSCAGWAVDSGGLPIASAAPQDGSCGERHVDQSAGRWVCVSS